MSVTKTIDKSLKTMKKSSSALHISHDKQKLRGSLSSQRLEQTSRDLSKFFKPKVLINPKEVNWLSYAQVKSNF